MMQSGLGNETELKRFAIPLIQHLPGVGCNLHDHISFGLVWEATAVPLPLAPRSQSVCFWKTEQELEAPNAMAYGIPLPFMTPENGSKFNPPSACWSIAAGMRGKSRGEVRLTGSGAADPPQIRTNFLADPDDLTSALRLIELCREIGNSAALTPFQRREVAPGRLDKADLEAFVRNGVGTYWHQSGTAKMGRDNMAVVDSRMTVYGVEGLRVADASILPRVTTGNTMAPCVVIGERAADILQAEHKAGSDARSYQERMLKL
jgi:choline dehydrogenase